MVFPGWRHFVDVLAASVPGTLVPGEKATPVSSPAAVHTAAQIKWGSNDWGLGMTQAAPLWDVFLAELWEKPHISHLATDLSSPTRGFSKRPGKVENGPLKLWGWF